jgi:hypothetical protein
MANLSQLKNLAASAVESSSKAAASAKSAATERPQAMVNVSTSIGHALREFGHSQQSAQIRTVVLASPAASKLPELHATLSAQEAAASAHNAANSAHTAAAATGLPKSPAQLQRHLATAQEHDQSAAAHLLAAKKLKDIAAAAPAATKVILASAANANQNAAVTHQASANIHRAAANSVQIAPDKKEEIIKPPEVQAGNPPAGPPAPSLPSETEISNAAYSLSKAREINETPLAQRNENWFEAKANLLQSILLGAQRK